jgi:hypothetical protein
MKNIFGGEQYSREAYEDAEEEKKSARSHYDGLGTGIYEGGSRFVRHEQAVYDNALKSIEKADKRLERLLEKGHKEAVALNEKYDLLKRRAEEAMQDLVDFEKNQLGMHEEDEETDEK